MPATRRARPDDQTAILDDRGMDLRDFIRALQTRWKTIALSTAITTGLGLSYLAFTPTTYTATVSILVDARPRAPIGSDPAANANAQADTLLVESQVKLLSSDTVLRRVVQREGLADDPEYAPPASPGLRQRLMALIGLGGKPGGEDRASRAVQTLARSVVVKRSERTYVIDVDVSGRDPLKAARLANSLADAYLADQIDARSSVVRRDSQWLDQRIGELQARVQEAENRAQAYRIEHGITDANGKSIGEQELADISTELGKARARSIDAKTRWEKFRDIVKTARINDLPADLAHSGVIDKLRGQLGDIQRQEANLRTSLGDRHPAMLEIQNQLRDTRQQIVQELKRLADAAGVEYQVARAAESETGRKVEEARKATENRNKSSVELRELERDVDASKSVYEKFLRARASIDEANADGPAARVIAPALAPTAPSAPKTMAIVFASIASGLFAGVGIALFSDYLASPVAARRPEDSETPDGDRRGPTRAEIEDDGERAPILAITPAIGARRAKIGSWLDWMMKSRADEEGVETSGSPLEEVETNQASEFSKSIAALYDGLMGERRRPRGARRAPVILIASMDDGAGKTTIAVNLARHAARAGKHVLVIDGNAAHPALSDAAPHDAPMGLVQLGDATRPIIGAAQRLWFVPILPNEERVVARLERRRNIERFEGLSDEFDIVIIDGPTIDLDGAARDVAFAADRVVVVARNGARAPLLDDIVEILDVPARKIAGMVFTSPSGKEAA